MDPGWLPFMSLVWARGSLSTAMALSAGSRSGLMFPLSTELHSPVSPCYILYHGQAGRTKIPFERCLYVGLKTVRMECALQTPFVPNLCKTALFSLCKCFSGRDVCD